MCGVTVRSKRKSQQHLRRDMQAAVPSPFSLGQSATGPSQHAGSPRQKVAPRLADAETSFVTFAVAEWHCNAIHDSLAISVSEVQNTATGSAARCSACKAKQQTPSMRQRAA